ncbi:MAG: formylglycine-generating enzyme family protein [Planctomycetota bacterium]
MRLVQVVVLLGFVCGAGCESRENARGDSTKRLPRSTTNSIGQQLVLIPAGGFLMGSPDGESGRHSGEGPQLRVEITWPFCMGRTEVTQEQWKQVMGTEPWKDEDSVREGDEYAASCISWDDAMEFCRRLSRKEGKTYRLPTEAEWEYACRAGTTTRFSFGDDESQLGRYAWFFGNAYNEGEKYAHRVGQKHPNSFGLFDMHGNVREWCGDCYDGESRVLRGGSWSSVPHDVRCAYRDLATPEFGYEDDGFRLVLESCDWSDGTQR